MTIASGAPVTNGARGFRRTAGILLAAGLALAPVAGFAGWDWLNPRPTPYELWSVAFGDAESGVLVGDGGLVLSTSDGGATWTPRESSVPIDESLYRVHFIDPTTVIAVGGHIDFTIGITGTLARSTDAGVSWARVGDPVPNLLFSDASFRDVNHGFAVGADFTTGEPTISRTDDGGASWSTQSFSYVGYLLGVAFPKPSVGFAVGYDFAQSQAIILRTTDGGGTWEPQDAVASGQLLNDVKFAGTDVGVIVGNGGTLFTTTNGGTRWQQRDSGTTLDLHGVTFIGTGTIVVTGGNYLDQGVVLTSIDDGATWSSQLFDRSLNGAFFGDAESGSAVGSGGEILHTNDGGQSWNTEQESVSTDGLFGVAFASPRIGTGVGEGGAIVRTKDGGQTWRIQSSGTSLTLYGVAAADDNNLMAVGGDTGSFEHVIVATADGGTTWIDRTPPDLLVPMLSVACPAIGVCTAVGECGKIVHTDDGGATWTTQRDAACGAYLALESVEFTDVENGIAVGPDTILQTNDGGATWTYQTAPTDQVLHSITFVDARNGFIAGGGQEDRGTILRTSDGGATWTVQREDIPQPVQSVSFANLNDGVAVTLGGEIYRTYDGGATWSLDTSVIANLYGVVYKDNATAIAVGYWNNNAVILGWNDRVFASGFELN